MFELLNQDLFGTTLLNWLLVIAAAAAITALVALVRRIKDSHGKESGDFSGSKLAQQREEASQRLRDVLNNMLQHTHKTLVFVVTVYFAMRVFDVAPEAMPVLRQITLIAALLQLGWWGEGLILRWFEMAYERHIPEGAKSLALGVMWVAVILAAVDSLGFDISQALTGLGITGVAVALSTRQVLGDLFAFFSITSDKPFQRGDFIVVGDCSGNVEHIGLRSTRIRSLSGEQVVFANSVLLEKRIQNFKTLKARRIVIRIGVVYETEYETLVAIPGLVAELFESIELANFDRAHFSDYGESSLDFEIVYYVMTSDYKKYMDIRQQVQLAIFQRFEEQGIKFAYPTRKLLLDDDQRVTAGQT
jgi:small-conductance mechanosensitive channel